jgi:hypothetical protein
MTFQHKKAVGLAQTDGLINLCLKEHKPVKVVFEFELSSKAKDDPILKESPFSLI